MPISPYVFQGLTIAATSCLVLALIFGRKLLRQDRELRRGIHGLLATAMAGVILAFDPPNPMVWPLVVVMMGGLLMVIFHVGRKNAMAARGLKAQRAE